MLLPGALPRASQHSHSTVDSCAAPRGLNASLLPGQNLVDPSQLQVLRLSAQEATRIPPHFRPSGLTNSSGAFLDLPLDQGLYHWTLQWQRDEALREKVGCISYTAAGAAQADLLSGVQCQLALLGKYT